jgi:hypothetical protein
MQRGKLIKGYKDLLDAFSWDIYLTVTFKKSTKLAAAGSAFRYFFKHLNTSDYKFFEKYIKCFVFFEKHKFDRGVHIHSLIQGLNPSFASALENKCLKFFGESKVDAYRYDLPRPASDYLARKCLGSSLEHWDYLKINSKLRG